MHPKKHFRDMMQTSFHIIPKAGNIGIFVLLNFGTKLDIVIIHTNSYSMYHNEFKLAEQFVLLVTVSYLFPLKVIPMRQYCHLYALRENPISKRPGECLQLVLVDATSDWSHNAAE